MGSPITLSGFNNIDFSMILNAIMQQERVPVTQLETQKVALQAQKSAFGTLASKLAALDAAAEALTKSTAFNGSTMTVSDSTRLQATTTGTAPAGTYEIVVQQLARAQVTTSATVYQNADDIVADGGTLVIGGKSVTLTGPVTLQGLAAAINATADIGVAASAVRGEQGFQLVLTGAKTGEAHAFTVDASGLTLADGTPIAFSGSPAQQASDAAVSVNNVVVKSESNRFSGVVAGVDFTVLKQDVGQAVTLTITASTESVKSLVQKLVTAFNDVLKFLDDQSQAAGRGETNNIGRDSLVRGLRRTLVSSLNAKFESGDLNYLALAGIEFNRSGQLTFNAAAFDTAVSTDRTSVIALFRGTDGTGGAFGTLASTIDQYTKAGGFVPGAQNRVTTQVTAISKRITELETRLETRRLALQKEFIAADQAIAQLNASMGQLGSLGQQYRQF
jgi:flagellar hook-associated protein 2